MSKELISAYEAAKRMGCTVHNVWAMIRRLSLKAVKRNNKWVTCDEWIAEYYENKRCKDTHSIWNGRRVFDPKKGELSLNMVAKELGLAKSTMFYYINSGALKSHRKGHYVVVMRDDLEYFKAMRSGQIEEHAQNA